MAELDNLYIKIQAEAVKANDAIDRLDNKLERLEIALERIRNVNLSSFTNSISDLSKSVTSLKTTGFSRLAENINKLSNLDTSKFSHIPDALNQMVGSLNKVATLSDNAQNIGLLASNISKLGNKTATNAITNIPQLTKGLETLIVTLSKTPQVNQSLIDMTNALANLASQGSKVGSASKTMVSGLNRTNTAMARTRAQATSLASAFGKFYASYFLIIRGVKGLWGAIEDSMDYVETYNYFNVALGKIGEETAARFGEFGKESAESYAKEFGDRLNELNKKMTGYIVGDEGELILAGDMGLGLNIEQMMNFQAKVLSVTNSVGLMGEASTSTAKALTMLAGDYSSLTNLPVEQVMEKLTSGMIGQSRALYSLGIDITNNTLQQYAYAEGISKAVSEMTQSEKMQLRLLAILDQSEVAWGDLGNTVDSVANQYRVFQQQIGNLGRTFGSLFLPIVQNVLPYVNGVVIALNNLFTSLGFSMYGDTWLSDLQDGISGSVQGDVGELEDGLEDASDAANKLKKSLSSFDELDVISISGVSSAADAEGVIDLTESIADALVDYENKWNEAFEGAENRAAEFAKVFTEKLEPIKTVFSDLFSGDFDIAAEDLSGLIASTTLALSGAIEKIDWELVGNKVGEFMAGIDWATIGEGVAELLFSAIQSGIELWEGAFDVAPVETAIISSLALMSFNGITFPMLLGSATSAASEALAGGISLKTLLFNIGTFSFSSPIGLEIGNKILTELEDWTLKNFGQETVDAIGASIGLITATGFGAIVGGPIGALVGFVVGSVIDWFAYEEYTSDIADAFLEGLSSGLTKVGNKLGNWNKTKETYDILVESFLNLKDAKGFEEIGTNIVNGILAGILLPLEALTEPFVDLFDWIYEGICDAFGIEKGRPAEKMKELGSSIIDGISSGFSAAFDGLEATFKELWNEIADWINEKLTWEIDPVKIMGKTIFEGATIELGKLPKFYYNGGFPQSADLFYANENGVPELVGTMGGRTAVASGTEITGIRDAIQNAHEEEMSIMRRQNEILMGILQKEFGISREEIFGSVVALERENYRTSGESIFMH